MDTQPEFGEVLKKAKAAGVKILAYDCQVTEDSIKIDEEVPVVLEKPILWETVDPIVAWYRENKRDLPWRHDVTPYRVWVSEIMLQQTRVEAVKPYYDRFLKELPTITDLANAKEDRLMKLWEGLGYYNRVRNMQKAAIQMVEQYGRSVSGIHIEEIQALIRNWKLYGREAIGSFCVWNTKTGGGWKCAACGVSDSGKQRRYYESQSPYGDRDGTGGSDSKRLSGRL